MPELPEVETVVRGLRSARLVGRRICGALVRWPRIVATPRAAAFRRAIAGRRIERISRRGKYVVMGLSGGLTLLVHLRMTGRLALTRGRHAADAHERLALNLDDGRALRYHDTRKFGRWSLLRDPAGRLDRLGPEPLAAGFTAAVFAARLGAHDRALKPLLLDQSFLAGLGNIYVDEALWAAQLHPARRSGSLTERERRRLHRAIRQVLAGGIRRGGTTLGKGDANFYSVAGRAGRNQEGLLVFRRTGRPCPRCGARIERLVIAQRSSHICPRCQKPHNDP